jgi:predicted Zn finger-like uncharacterized protein
MQFSCESCKALLQISDEKLRGKRLVVKCKRCGSRIQIADPALRTPSRVEPVVATPHSVSTVSGVPTAADTDTESTRAIDTALLARALRQSKEEGAPSERRPQEGEQPSWFALILNKQEGPFSKAELALKAAQGLIGPKTYLWREGMGDWARAKDVPEAASFFEEPPLPAKQPTPVSVPQVVTATPVQTRPPDQGVPMPVSNAPASQPQDRSDRTPETSANAADSASDLAQWASSNLEHEAQDEPLVGKQPTRDERVDTRPRGSAVAQPAPASRSGPWLFAAVVIVLIALGVAAAVMFMGHESATTHEPQVAEPKPEQPQPPPPKTPADTTARTPAVGLSAEVVRRKIDENKGNLQRCIDEALRYTPNLKVGRIHIATTIAPTGHVTGAKIDKKAVDETALGTCLKLATRKIVFPPFTGDPFIVDIPIQVSSE